LNRAIQVLVLAGVMVALFVSTISAYANGAAGVEVFKGQQGPYEVTVRTYYPKPPLGDLHLTVIVQEVVDQRLVSNASVTVEATGPEGSVVGPVEALNSLASPQYYDISLLIGVIGVWQFQVTVDSDLGEERLTFPFQMYDATVNWGAVITILVAVLLAVPIGASGYRILQQRVRDGGR
jgi:hypothetical protein